MRAKTSHVVGTAAGMALLGVLVGPAGAAVVVKQTLQPTGVVPGAQGVATVVISSRGPQLRGRLKVIARNLAPAHTFGVSLDGVRIGTFDTNGAGKGRAQFSSDPKGHDQLLGTDPQGKTVSIEDEAGEDDLQGDIPDESGSATDVRCCVANDSGTECDETSAAECQAKGGTDMGAGSCLPSPCTTTPPPPPGEDIRCCKPGGEGPECDMTTAAECAAANGTNIGAGSCAPDACAPVSSTAIRCCVAGNGGTECEHMTADHCTAAHGTNAGAGSCEPNPCGTSPSGAFAG